MFGSHSELLCGYSYFMNSAVILQQCLHKLNPYFKNYVEYGVQKA